MVQVHLKLTTLLAPLAATADSLESLVTNPFENSPYSPLFTMSFASLEMQTAKE